MDPDPRGPKKHTDQTDLEHWIRVGYLLPVGGHDDDGRHIVLERPVEEGEALHVEHVNLVDEKHAGRNLRLALLPPFGYFRVYLVPHLHIKYYCRISVT